MYIDVCESPLNYLPSIRSVKCYSRVCLKVEFLKCQGKIVNIFVYKCVVFLFKTNVMFCFPFLSLLHYFENTVSKQSVEKNFVFNFMIMYYVQIEWKVKFLSSFFNDAIRKYSFVLRYKTCIVRITEFSFL